MQNDNAHYLKWHKVMVFSVLLFNFIYGLFAWAQYQIFHHVFVPSITIKMVAVVLAIIWVLYMARSKFRGILLVDRKILWTYGIWMAYSLLNLVLLTRFAYSLFYIAFTFVVMLLYPSLFFFLTIAPEEAGKNQLTPDNARRYYGAIKNIILIVGGAALLLGLAQWILDLPLINTSGHYYHVMSFQFLGKTRAFSFFSAPLYYGRFLVIVLLLLISALVLRENKVSLKWGIFVVLLLTGIYSTYTRNVDLDAVLSMFTLGSLLMARKLHGGLLSKLAKLLPFAYLAAIVFVVVVLPLHQLQSNHSLLNSTSLNARLAIWQHVIHGFKGWSQWMFGTGLMQNNRFPVTQGIVVDNTFLGIILYQGIVGLVLYLAFFYALWNRMVDIVLQAETLTALDLSVASITSAVLATGMFNMFNFGESSFFMLIASMMVLHSLRENRLVSRYSLTQNLSRNVNKTKGSSY